MSKIDYQALREAAEKATPGNWWIDSHGQSMVSFIDNEVLEVFVTDNKRDAVRHEDTGNLSRWRNDNDATFIATANPATVLALLDELEAAEKRIAELEAREISLPERSSMLHRTDFHDDYQTVMAYKVSEVIDAIRAAGIRIKGGES
ncbi:TPA: ead/Ea22-like family protein [Escherichia coli]